MTSLPLGAGSARQSQFAARLDKVHFDEDTYKYAYGKSRLLGFIGASQPTYRNQAGTFQLQDIKQYALNNIGYRAYKAVHFIVDNLCKNIKNADSFKQVPSDQQEHFTLNVLPLLSLGMSVDSAEQDVRQVVIQTFANVPAAEWESVSAQAAKLTVLLDPASPRIRADDYCAIIQTVASVPVVARENVVSQAIRLFTQDVYHGDGVGVRLSEIILALAALGSEDDRQSVTDLVLRLASRGEADAQVPMMDVHEVYCVLTDLIAVERDQRESVATQVLKFMVHSAQFPESEFRFFIDHYGSLIKNFSSISTEHRDSVADQALRFFSPSMIGTDLRKIITLLKRIRTSEVRLTFTTQALRLLPQPLNIMKGSDVKNIVQIFYHYRNKPDLFKETVSAFVEQLFSSPNIAWNLNTTGQHAVGIVEALCELESIDQIIWQIERVVRALAEPPYRLDYNDVLDILDDIPDDDDDSDIDDEEGNDNGTNFGSEAGA